MSSTVLRFCCYGVTSDSINELLLALHLEKPISPDRFGEPDGIPRIKPRFLSYKTKLLY